MRRLPPLNALRVFEVAARTASYAEAGTELGLTHGAVSRQIAALESWLATGCGFNFKNPEASNPSSKKVRPPR
jgi:hypothetical protein